MDRKWGLGAGSRGRQSSTGSSPRPIPVPRPGAARCDHGRVFRGCHHAKGHDLELKRHPNRPRSHARVIYRRGGHQDEGLETHLTGQEAMTFPSPTTTHVKEGRLVRQPRDMPWRSAWPRRGDACSQTQACCGQAPGAACPPREGWARPRGHRQASSCRG